MSKITVDNLRKASESADRDISGVAAAWGKANGAGTTINDSLNISSITDSGTGWITWNMNNDMASGDYSACNNSQLNSITGTGGFYSNGDLAAATAGSFAISHYQNGVAADPSYYSVQIHGDLA